MAHTATFFSLLAKLGAKISKKLMSVQDRQIFVNVEIVIVAYRGIPSSPQPSYVRAFLHNLGTSYKTFETEKERERTTARILKQFRDNIRRVRYTNQTDELPRVAYPNTYTIDMLLLQTEKSKNHQINKRATKSTRELKRRFGSETSLLFTLCQHSE